MTEVLYGHDLFIDKFPVWLYLINELTIVWYGHDSFIDKVPVRLYLQNKLTIVRYGHDLSIDKVPVRLCLQNMLTIVWYSCVFLNRVDNLLIWLSHLHWQSSYTAVFKTGTVDKDPVQPWPLSKVDSLPIWPWLFTDNILIWL